MTDDPRVTCATCRNLQAGWCSDAKRAGLPVITKRAEIGRTLAELPQHCPAYVADAKKVAQGH